VEDIQRLNPRVRVVYDTSTLPSKERVFFQQFDVIIATDINLSTMVARLPFVHLSQILLNEYSRTFNIPFYTASLHGLIGIVFVDLIKHSYVITAPPKKQDKVSAKDKDSAPQTIQKSEIYAPLQESISTKYGKSLKPRQARKVSHLLPLSLGALPSSNLSNPSSPIVVDGRLSRLSD